MTLAQHAMELRKAFIWPHAEQGKKSKETQEAVPNSVTEFHIESAMYAPLLWKDDVLGVVCVDNAKASPAFVEGDLKLLLAVAQHAAMAAANHHLQIDLQQSEMTLNNLLKMFPQIADRLKRQRGRARLGGEYVDATILFAE